MLAVQPHNTREGGGCLIDEISGGVALQTSHSPPSRRERVPDTRVGEAEADRRRWATLSQNVEPGKGPGPQSETSGQRLPRLRPDPVLHKARLGRESPRMARGCEEDTDISRLSSVRWQRRARTSDTSVRGGPRRHLRTRRAWTGDSLHAPYTCALETLFITQSLQVVIGDDICVDAERSSVDRGEEKKGGWPGACISPTSAAWRLRLSLEPGLGGKKGRKKGRKKEERKKGKKKK
ncbi:hypothetical protein C0Q70_07375 [Pomacea canaliculata]|uniref:Uncharacterized protein n=1 Tax=Pomacea canaliculata TaxID=400727 RepID=A0A2T7PEV4_POMCA|nr:hypothetical protein C0Q70_07375 [Pomacea canaliculata]